MQGHVLAFRPDSGQGAIVTDAGDVLPFRASPQDTRIDGGDIVAIDANGKHRGGGVVVADHVRLIAAHPDASSREYARKLKQLLDSVEMLPARP